ncbi:MAG TPA: hypothetical protein VG692_04460 [Gemmatimonadales bacterium]|nr:hypothetical protein [Gemmatimonadales bacterium]
MQPHTGSTRWGILVALVALGGSALSWGLSGGAVFSPGGLSGARDSTSLGGIGSHAELDRRCGACHPGPFSGGTMSARCLACHTDIAGELPDSGTLHGSLEGARACLACHTEHRGRDGALTRFEGSGIAHDRFGFSLAAHQERTGGAPFLCTDCHGGRDFAFDAARCERCHRDEQPAFVRRHVEAWGHDCRGCHDGADRFGRNRFVHDSTGFPLTGEHRIVECAGCHTTTRSLAAFRDAPTACAACHQKDDRHRGGFGSDCASCHDTRSWEGARFDHTFPIDHGERGRVACRTCHVSREDWKQYTCYGCHEHTPARIAAEHREEGVGRDLTDCVRCHATGREEGEGGERED